MNQKKKAAPTMVLIIMLISMTALAGIFLSIPMGVLVTKFGTFKTGLCSLIAIILGCILGATAPAYNVMLVSRVIEGIGLMFLGTIGPAAVAQSYSDKKRGVAMGIQGGIAILLNKKLK